MEGDYLLSLDGSILCEPCIRFFDFVRYVIFNLNNLKRHLLEHAYSVIILELLHSDSSILNGLEGCIVLADLGLARYQ